MSRRMNEIIGWYATSALLVSYLLVSFEVISPTGLLYQVFNLSAAIGFIIHFSYRKDYSPVVLNIVRSFIAVAALVTYYLPRFFS